MRRPLALTALAAFLAFDAFLVVVAVRHVGAAPPSSDIQQVATGDEAARQQVSDQVAFEFTPAQAGAMSVSNRGTVITAVRGTCRGKAGVVRTASSDSELQVRDVGVRQVLAVRATDDRLTVVGTNDACAPVQRSSTDGGRTWSDDPQVQLWHPSADNVRRVVAPGGTGSPPGCTIISLSQVGSDFGRVACADGKLFGSGNSGRSWVLLGRLDNARVIAFTSFNDGYALARYQGCAANAFTTDDSGRTWKPGGCITGDPARAIAANDSGLTAVVGAPTSLFVSADKGEDWKQR